jgi:hypothetical protein
MERGARADATVTAEGTRRTSFVGNHGVNWPVEQTRVFAFANRQPTGTSCRATQFDRVTVSESPCETAGKAPTLPDCFRGEAPERADPPSPIRILLSNHGLHGGGTDASVLQRAYDTHGRLSLSSP